MGHIAKQTEENNEKIRTLMKKIDIIEKKSLEKDDRIMKNEQEWKEWRNEERQMRKEEIVNRKEELNIMKTFLKISSSTHTSYDFQY